MFLTAPFLLLLIVQAPPAAAPSGPDNDTCLSCHGEPSLTVQLPSGEEQKLYVDAEALARSVHGGRLRCVDCHADIKDTPHDSRPFRSTREFTLAYYEQCKRCHFDKYTKTLDSVHYAAVARGDRSAPVCVDCHGSHAIAKAKEPRVHVSQTCAKCHEGIATTFGTSVHGRNPGNPDVPTCADCHRAHDVVGPHEAGWRATTPQLCGSCHADEKRMKKYGLSTAVLKTYLSDFHGATATLKSGVTATCSDCHGVHDIQKVSAPDSPVVRANLVKTCRKCHAEAADTFPAAWLSHYEPSLAKAPLVFGVQLAYAILIPFMIGGLVLQILLHFWRVVVNR
jgi:predicted CXXCH cytochrome family protein